MRAQFLFSEIRIGLRPVDRFDPKSFEQRLEQIERGIEFVQFEDERAGKGEEECREHLRRQRVVHDDRTRMHGAPPRDAEVHHRHVDETEDADHRGEPRRLSSRIG